MPVRVGFVGAGGNNSGHMQRVATIRGTKIVAVCDVQSRRAQERAEQYGATAYTDYRKMLDAEEMDALYVSVPPFAHEHQEILAAKRGIHLFVEKPVALTMRKARQVAKAIEDNGVISTAGFQDRYLSNIKQLRVLLDGQTIGLMMGYWMGGMPGVPWWRVREQSGGQIVEQTIHIFDMARYLFGEVTTVHAAARQGLMTHVPNYNVDDASAVTLEFESGLIGTIFSACFLQVGHRGGLDIWTRDLFVNYAERGPITVHEAGKKKPKVLGVRNNPSLDLDKAFINAVKKQDQSVLKSDYADAARTLEVCLAANKSLATGRVVKLSRN